MEHTSLVYEYIVLLVTGLFAGLTGGMLGVGGGIVMIPAMTELLGPNQHLYQAAAMIVNFFVVVPAVYHHRRAGAIDFPTVRRLIPLAAVAVILGVALSELPIFTGARQIYLIGLFGLFLLCMSGCDIYLLLHRGDREVNRIAQTEARHERTKVSSTAPNSPIGWRVAALVALPTGVVAGLLGVGGGIAAVPLQRRFFKVPMRSAIANSATIIIATSLIGAGLKNYRFITANNGSWESLRIAAILIPPAIVGVSIGSRLTHRLPLTVVKIAFMALLFVAGGRLVYRAVAPAIPPTMSSSSKGADSAHGSWSNEPIAVRAPGETQLSGRPPPIAPKESAPQPIGGCPGLSVLSTWKPGGTTRRSAVADHRRSMMGKLANGRTANRQLATANRRLPIRKAMVRGSCRLAAGLALLSLTLSAGCDSEIAKEFREVASPSLQSGVSSILDGVVDGVFAVVDPDT